jgi:hypothetical protein
MDETFQLLMLPDDVLTNILKFLDMKTLISGLSVVCKLFCPFCERSSKARHLCLGYIDHIYESFMFSKGGFISEPIPEDDYQPRYFRPNVILSLGNFAQPLEVRIHVFTLSDSEVIRLSGIVSMVIELSPSNDLSGKAQ